MFSLSPKVLLSLTIITGVLMAVLFLTQLWLDFFTGAIFTKLAFTILIAGSLTGFLMALKYDLPTHPARIMMGLMAVGMFALATIILLQMWFDFFAGDLFWKVLLSNIILLILGGFIVAVKEDFGEHKRLKDENYLD